MRKRGRASSSARRIRTPIRELSLARTLPAPPEAVYDAWTDGDLLAHWMRPFGAVVTEALVDFETGGWYRIDMRGREGAWSVTGKFIEAERPRRLRFSWESPVTLGRPTIVTLVLIGRGADEEQTLLELSQEQLQGDLSAERHEALWNDVLDRLARFLAGRR